MKWQDFLSPFGMVSALCYALLIFGGQAMWSAYSPADTFVSYLTADGAPNARPMQIVNTLHGLFLLLYTMGFYQRARRTYHRLTKRGSAALFAMAAITLIGFALTPLRVDEPFDSPHNLVHFIIAVCAIAATILAGAAIGVGHMRYEGRRGLGSICLILDGCICFFGLAALYCTFFAFGIVGIVQRLMLFSMEGFVAALSFAHTFGRGTALIPTTPR